LADERKIRRGRPSHLTPEVADRLVAELRDGADLSSAARAAGVPRRTVYDWIARGRAEPYGRFLGRVESARAARQPERSWEEVARELEQRWALDDALARLD
jgi:hypothetical protein